MQFLSNRRLKAEIRPRLPITSVLAVNCRWGLCVRNTECAQLPAIEVNTFDRQTCWCTEIATILHAAVVQSDNHLGIIWQWGLYLMQHTHRKRSSVTIKNKNKKQLVRRLKLSPPPSQTHTQTHTHQHACNTHLLKGIWENTSTHLPSLCLFMVSLVLIPSHSISFTSASSLYSFATTVFSPALASCYYVWFHQ